MMGGFSEEDRIRNGEVVAELEKISWRQKSWALWLVEEYNYISFLSVANSHWRNNAIEMLHIEGLVLWDHFEIKACVVHCYEDYLQNNLLVGLNLMV